MNAAALLSRICLAAVAACAVVMAVLGLHPFVFSDDGQVVDGWAVCGVGLGCAVASGALALVAFPLRSRHRRLVAAASSVLAAAAAVLLLHELAFRHAFDEGSVMGIREGFRGPSLLPTFGLAVLQLALGFLVAVPWSSTPTTPLVGAREASSLERHGLGGSTSRTR